ncbi:hypothetical protein SpCBS45565_g03444 [Spizellomyces sp. 'palustris']|nr:hypothetical protein SpCBS45565_g03444 [Spizellomyces sp. 'palustris']
MSNFVSSGALPAPTWGGIHIVTGSDMNGLLNGGQHAMGGTGLLHQQLGAGAAVDPVHMIPKSFMTIDPTLFNGISPDMLFAHGHQPVFSAYESHEMQHDNMGQDRSDSPTLSSSLSDEAGNSISGEGGEGALGIDELLDFGDGVDHSHHMGYQDKSEDGGNRGHAGTDAGTPHTLALAVPSAPQMLSMAGPSGPGAFYSTMPPMPNIHMMLPGTIPFPTQFTSPYLGPHYSPDSTTTSPATAFHFAPGSVPPLPKKIAPAASSPGHLACPYAECDKTFAKPFALRAHVKSHGAERTYRCELCEASFRRSHDLKRHFRSIHTVIKPFGCESCGKRFSRMDALKRHVSRQGSPCYVRLP